MVRSGLPVPRPTPKVRPAATILFAGPLGAGVGIAADVFADVARLSHRTVARRRDFTNVAASLDGSTKPGVLQLVTFGDAANTADIARVDLAIAWDEASAAVLRAAGIVAVETIVVAPASPSESFVPAWRHDLITDAVKTSESRSSSSRSAGLQKTARALKTLSERTPFARELWRRVLKLHVPARRRRATIADFTK